MNPHRTDTDVLVAGGGPVGLAAAIEARRAGYDVVVVEPRRTPIDKACGEGLMPGALAALHELDVDPAGHPLIGISYRDTRRHVEHRFRNGPGRGVRRTVLQRALQARAEAAGVTFVLGRIEKIGQRSDGVDAAGISARWLLACDGLHSRIRRLAGLEVSPAASFRRPGSARGAVSLRQRYRFGLRRHFRLVPWTDFVEVYWGRGVEAYVTPVADEEVGVALLGPRGLDYEQQLASFGELQERLQGAETAGPVRGAGPLRQMSRRRVAGRVRLVGDASGYVDALTGEGLRVGFAQARAAVATLQDGPQEYERAWARATRDYRLLTSGLVRWANSPVRGAVVPAAKVLPGLYGAVVDRLAH